MSDAHYSQNKWALDTAQTLLVATLELSTGPFLNVLPATPHPSECRFTALALCKDFAQESAGQSMDAFQHPEKDVCQSKMKVPLALTLRFGIIGPEVEKLDLDALADYCAALS